MTAVYNACCALATAYSIQIIWGILNYVAEKLGIPSEGVLRIWHAQFKAGIAVLELMRSLFRSMIQEIVLGHGSVVPPIAFQMYWSEAE